MTAPPTLKRDEASPVARKLVEELRDVLSNEQAWHIAQKHLEAAWDRGWENGQAHGFAAGAQKR